MLFSGVCMFSTISKCVVVGTVFGITAATLATGFDTFDPATRLSRQASASTSQTPTIHHLYWTTLYTGTLRRVGTDGSNPTALVTGLLDPTDIELDRRQGKMYWVEPHYGVLPGTIKRANLDGTAIELLPIPGLEKPHGIALDLWHNKIYWADQGVGQRRIRRANLDGSEVEDVVTGLMWPMDIALDLPNNVMYWIEGRSFSSAWIRRANLDGTNPTVLITSITDGRYIALDRSAQMLYWTDRSRDEVKRARVDGTQIEVLRTGANNALGIAIDVMQQKLYWIDSSFFSLRAVYQANLDGSAVDAIASGEGQASGLTLALSNDVDADEIPDPVDNCPMHYNITQGDCDNDGVGDACESNELDHDDDSDGVCNHSDVCAFGDDKLDTDGDATPDECDPCPLDFLDDSDADGSCDSEDMCFGFNDGLDSDSDLVPNACDNCPQVTNSDQSDRDGDEVGDECDWCPDDALDDSDQDGVCDSQDICPGINDALDDDSDGNVNCLDVCPGVDDNIFGPGCQVAVPVSSSWALVIMSLSLIVVAKLRWSSLVV